MLRTRIIFAALLIPITLWVIITGGKIFALLIMLLMIGAMVEWVLMGLKTDSRAFFIATGFFYLFLTFDCLYTMRINQPLALGLMFLFMVWGSDTGAYFVGKKFGTTKMLPSVSPNKTWAGFRGGLATAALIGLVCSAFIPYFNSFAYNAVFFMILGSVTAVAGQGGDLLVSYVKRRAGVKDSGKLIPGHGGLLDRLDSLLLAAPIYLLLVTEVRHVFG